ncbi:MAG: CYTH domain-containing protein [Lentisphaerae bacterium]|nr:CYTH domain-containing protein [Lentisphaerota bacterium]
MGVETERKFLLKDHSWREQVTSLPKKLTQGYFLRAQGGPTVRVRIADDRAFLTVKGRSKGTENLTRSEFEYQIPLGDAAAMLEELCGTRVVKKLRFCVAGPDGFVWEIDEYLDLNAGLFTAEIELPDADIPFVKPHWLGAEVSGDKRYSNGSLSVSPFSEWGKDE